MRRSVLTHDRHRLLKELSENIPTVGVCGFSRFLKWPVESLSRECFFLPKREHDVHWTRVQAEEINMGHQVQGTAMCLIQGRQSNRVHSLVCESLNFVFSLLTLCVHPVLCTGVNNSLQASAYSRLI